jgi:hypothetical protein
MAKLPSPTGKELIAALQKIGSNSHYGNFTSVKLILLRMVAISFLEKPMFSFEIL